MGKDKKVQRAKKFIAETWKSARSMIKSTAKTSWVNGCSLVKFICVKVLWQLAKALGMYWMEFWYISRKYDNGSVDYLESTKKFWFQWSQIAFHTVWIVKIFGGKLGLESVQPHISDVLILGMMGNAMSAATAYLIGKKATLDRKNGNGE